MQLDLTALHAAAAKHTAAVQTLLNANAAHAAAATAAAKAVADAQTEVNALAAELQAQAATVENFNASNPAPAAA